MLQTGTFYTAVNNENSTETKNPYFGSMQVNGYPGSGFTPQGGYWGSSGSTKSIYTLVIDVTKIPRKKHPRI